MVSQDIGSLPPGDRHRLRLRCMETCNTSSHDPPQVLPNSRGQLDLLAGGSLIVQTSDMHRSLPCRIGRQWSAITAWLATPLTAFHPGSLLCRWAEFFSWHRPIVGGT